MKIREFDKWHSQIMQFWELQLVVRMTCRSHNLVTMRQLSAIFKVQNSIQDPARKTLFFLIRKQEVKSMWLCFLLCVTWSGVVVAWLGTGTRRRGPDKARWLLLPGVVHTLCCVLGDPQQMRDMTSRPLQKMNCNPNTVYLPCMNAVHDRHTVNGNS